MTEQPIHPASGVVPVFPLPNAVLFPHTVLPLHVFEPRYRQMVEDALQGERCIAIVLLRPGYEKDYEGSPEIFTVGTVGRIDELQRLPDGRFRFNLVGLQRADLREIPTDRPYRLARVLPRSEQSVDESDGAIRRAKLDLLTAQGLLLSEISGESGEPLAVDEKLPFAVAVNGACANLPVEPEIRQELLEIDDPRVRHERALQRMNEVLAKILEIKQAQAGEDDSRQLN